MIFNSRKIDRRSLQPSSKILRRHKLTVSDLFTKAYALFRFQNGHWASIQFTLAHFCENAAGYHIRLVMTGLCVLIFFGSINAVVFPRG